MDSSFFMYFSLLRYIIRWYRLRFLLDGCGLRFFSWTWNSVIFGNWRVSGGHVFLPLCGSLPRGAVIGWPFISLEVFDWHGGRCLLCSVCRFCISCAFVRGSATWGCCFGLPFISAEKFDWHVGAVLVLWCHAQGSNHVDLLLQSSFVVLCHVGLLSWLTIHFVGDIWLALVVCAWRYVHFSWYLADSFQFYQVIAPRSKYEYLPG